MCHFLAGTPPPSPEGTTHVSPPKPHVRHFRHSPSGETNKRSHEKRHMSRKWPERGRVVNQVGAHGSCSPPGGVSRSYPFRGRLLATVFQLPPPTSYISSSSSISRPPPTVLPPSPSDITSVPFVLASLPASISLIKLLHLH